MPGNHLNLSVARSTRAKENLVGMMVDKMPLQLDPAHQIDVNKFTVAVSEKFLRSQSLGHGGSSPRYGWMWSP
jgi:hypothetical protein